jgi:ribose 5-phosphate isomerase A
VATERLATEHGIALISLVEAKEIDIAIDGADEVDSNLDMIKGGGGALAREKLVALASKRRVMVVDWTKIVTTLGLTFKLPVEVLPFAWSYTARLLGELECVPQLRLKGKSPFETDNGNYIIDCKFEGISDPASLEKRIKLLPGVVESGLFVGIADLLIVGFIDRVEERHRNQ